MLTFYPEFEAESPEQVEVVFLLDLSCSMKVSLIRLKSVYCIVPKIMNLFSMSVLHEASSYECPGDSFVESLQRRNAGLSLGDGCL